MASSYYTLSCFRSIESDITKLTQFTGQIHDEVLLNQSNLNAVLIENDSIEHDIDELSVSLDQYRDKHDQEFRSINSTLTALAELQKKAIEREIIVTATAQPVIAEPVLSEVFTDLDQAREEAYLAVEQNPESIEAMVRLGQIYFEEGDDETALFYFEKIIDLDPANTTALQSLGRISSREKDSSRAIYLFSRLSRIEPQNPVHYYNLAREFYIAGELTESESAITKSLSLDGSSILSLNLAGRIFRSIGQTEQALSFFRQSLSIQENPLIFSLMGDIYREVNNSEKAFQSWEAALDILDGKTLKSFRTIDMIFSKMALYAMELSDFRKIEDYFRQTEEYGGNEDVYYCYLHSLRIQGEDKILNSLLSSFEQKYPESKYQSEVAVIRSWIKGA